MKIGIDYSPVSINQAGIGTLTKQVTAALLELETKHQFIIYTDSAEFQKLEEQYHYISRPKGPAAGLRWMRKVAQDARQRDVDFIISFSALTFPLVCSRVIQVVNDLSPLMYPRAFTWKQRLIYRAGLTITARRSKGIMFISDSVRKEFTAKYKLQTPTSFALLGIEHQQPLEPDKSEKEEIAERLNLDEKYLLSVSTLEPRKNYENMIKAFAKFHEKNPEYKYYIAGKPGWMYKGLYSLVKKLGADGYVKFLGFVTDKEKWLLIHRARAFLYVSHYEGFGIPNIEAYGAGIPVLTGDIPVLKEVMQDQALYADPRDVDVIAKQMTKLIKTEVEVSPEFLSRFSWKTFAEKLVELMHQVRNSA